MNRIGKEEKEVVKVGIDVLAIYTPRYVLNLTTLATARQVNPDKYTLGLGQLAMSVPPPGEDIVTMGVNAAEKALQYIDKQQIEILLFATESGIDQSKAAGLYLHELLGLPARCRTIELKQACYSATAAIHLALPYLREHPNKKILVVAADIARYGLESVGESSQGAGAIAMVLAAHPRILAIEPQSGFISESVMDFWRPNYRHEAIVDGKYSSKIYLTLLDKSFGQYTVLSGRHFNDHDYFCYHTPVPKLVEKAHHHLIKLYADAVPLHVDKQITDSLYYSQRIGNTYTASLYISLVSLLDNNCDDLTNKRIGFYSYGSGCVAEYFSGVVQPNYRDVLLTDYHQQLLKTRQVLDYANYQQFYEFAYIEDGGEQIIPPYLKGSAALTKINQHKRIYVLEQKSERFETHTPCLTQRERMEPEKEEACAPQEAEVKQTIWVPGKLILSGEHAVVYGGPALAMAINRYTKATITREAESAINFHLSDLAHRSHLSVQALKLLKEKIKKKYQRFIAGEYSIRQVLQKPFELAQVAIGIFTEALNLSLPHGVKIHLHSDIPIGCGLGSSAATVLSVMQSIAAYLHLSLSDEKLLQLALEAENLQHGHSSGLDLHIALKGGCLYFNDGKSEARTIPNLPMYLINTGTPISSTGECVERVAPYFKSSDVREDFAAVTNAMDRAVQQAAWPAMQVAIRDNHRLLNKIGVVPFEVKQFIEQVEYLGGAAKICGAGAVHGPRAGAVLATIEDQQSLKELCRRFAYNVSPITGALRGIHAA